MLNAAPGFICPICKQGANETNHLFFNWPFGALNFTAMAKPANSMNPNKTETRTFGGGCFWCMECRLRAAARHQIRHQRLCRRPHGEPDVPAGFAPGTTGHAEVTQIEFDPAKISYEKLLLKFSGRRTTRPRLNRQGADEGTPSTVPSSFTTAKRRNWWRKNPGPGRRKISSTPSSPKLCRSRNFTRLRIIIRHITTTIPARLTAGPSLRRSSKKLEKEKVIEKKPQARPGH